MKLFSKSILIVLVLFSLTSTLCAQTQVTVQPSIMILPFLVDYASPKEVIEKDFNMRSGFNAITSAFKAKGLDVEDFRTKLEIGLTADDINANTKQSSRQRTIESSLAEIIVEYDVKIIESSTDIKEVTINLNAFDAFTSKNLTSTICRSGGYRGIDLSRLSQRAVENCSDDFIATLQMEFEKMMERGRPVSLVVAFNPRSKYSSHSEIGADKLPMVDVLEQWLEINAHNGVYGTIAATDRITISNVRIPLRDITTGRRYTITKFARDLYLYLKNEVGIGVSKDADFGAVYINIL